MKARLKSFFWIVVVHLVYWVFAFLRLTWKLDEDALPPEIQERYKYKQVVVFGHFHEDDWPMISFYFNRPMIVMVSLSKDGSLLTMLLERLGFKVARGSSSRGSVSGFKRLVDLCRDSGVLNVSLAVDGPRGPRRKIKKGILKLAYILEAPIVFGLGEVERAWIAKSWAKTVLPKPFSKMRLKYVVAFSQEEVKEYMDSNRIPEALELMEKRLQPHLP
ncbi:DUF374 domain-containing protein [bacterium]|nr:DUF374 domain-containing protein [bacterium]